MHKSANVSLLFLQLLDPGFIFGVDLLWLGNFHLPLEGRYPTPEGRGDLHLDDRLIQLVFLSDLCFLAELIVDSAYEFLVEQQHDLFCPSAVHSEHLLGVLGDGSYFSFGFLADLLIQYLYRIHAVNTIVAHLAVGRLIVGHKVIVIVIEHEGERLGIINCSVPAVDLVQLFIEVEVPKRCLLLISDSFFE